MTRILGFIVDYMGFLWSGARFKIIGSEIANSNGGDALLLVESDRLRMRFVSDRTQLFLEFQPIGTPVPNEWFSIDLIRRMILGTRETSALLDESYAEFFHQHLDEIEERFSSENWTEVHSQLKALKVKRAKELFG
jgi:hypothetical protein